jgi:hypothetical protein
VEPVFTERLTRYRQHRIKPTTLGSGLLDALKMGLDRRQTYFEQFFFLVLFSSLFGHTEFTLTFHWLIKRKAIPVTGRGGP